MKRFKRGRLNQQWGRLYQHRGRLIQQWGHINQKKGDDLIHRGEVQININILLN